MAMTAKQLNYAKSLRQSIMIKVKKEKGWSNEEFHIYLESWGFGNSLRKLEIRGLKEVLSYVHGKTKGNHLPQSSTEYSSNGGEFKSPRAKYGLGQFDKQGDFVWSMLMQLDWTNDRFRKFLGVKYKTIHWNALTTKQKSGSIGMLKNYLSKHQATLKELRPDKEDLTTKSTNNTNKKGKDEQ